MRRDFRCSAPSPRSHDGAVARRWAEANLSRTSDSVQAPFWRTLEAHSEATALVDARRGSAISYRDLVRSADAFAAALECGRKALVTLRCRNDLDSIVCLIGILRAGHAAHLVGARISDDGLDACMTAFRPAFLVTPGSAGLDPHVARQAPWGQVHPDLGLLMMTSGSEGCPKAVRLAMRALSASALQVRRGLAISPGERAFLSLPISHVYGLSVLTSHLAAGASVAITDCSILDPAFGSLARASEATSLAGVAFTYEQARKLGWRRAGFDQFDTFTHSGDHLPADLSEWVSSQASAAGARFFRMYGMTEACGRISILPTERAHTRLASVGRAVPGTTIEIAPDGEVIVSGPNVMMGYATSPQDLALPSETGGRFATGDLGYLEDGELILTGRTSTTIKVMGRRFDLRDLAVCYEEVGPAVACEEAGSVVISVELPAGEDRTTELGAAAARTKLPPGHLTVHCVHTLRRSQTGKRLPPSAAPDNSTWATFRF